MTIVQNKSSHLAKVQSFLKGHPKYGQLMRHLKELPEHLLPKDGLNFGYGSNATNIARKFRSHVAMPMKKWGNPSKYIGSAAKQLNGRLRMLRGVGRYATWYVPATLGLICVATAPPEMRIRTLFIVKRYEQQTSLLDTVFFKEHATFTRYIPDFFSSAMIWAPQHHFSCFTTMFKFKY
jgi:hypothetical protein